MFCNCCGYKYEDESNNFCPKCGAKRIITSGNKKEPVDASKLVLILGIFLVLFASFIFGFMSWKESEAIYKVGFFAFESILFFVFSFLLSKIKSKLKSVFFIIGLVLIPYTLTIIPYYKLLSSYFLEGVGLYIYLAICYLVVSIAFIIVNIKYKNIFVKVIYMITLLISFICAALTLKECLEYALLGVVIYLFIINILNTKNSKTISIVSYVILFLFIPFFFLAYVFNRHADIIIHLILFIFYVINHYIVLLRFDNDVFKGLSPFFINCAFIISTFDYNLDDRILYIIGLTPTLLYLLSLIINSKLFSNISLFFAYAGAIVGLLLSFSKYTYLPALIISSVILVINLLLIIVNKKKFINFFIPFNIFLIVLSLLNMFIDLNITYAFVITAGIMIIIYVIFKIFNLKYALGYLVTALIVLFLSFINEFNSLSTINVIATTFIAIIFLLSYLYKEKLVVSVITYVILNIKLLILFDVYTPFYSLLTISFITLLFSFIISKANKTSMQPYVLYSLILIIVNNICSSLNFSYYILIINFVVYILGFAGLLKYYKNRLFRTFYSILGLIIITKYINVIFVPVVISSIVSFIAIGITLTILYLAEINNKKEIAIMSFALLIPYYTLINEVAGDIRELYLFPLVIYTIVITEVIDFKHETNKMIATIIPLTFISLLFIATQNGSASIISDIVLAVIFILLGIIRKYNYFIYFGIIFILLILFARIFTILNSSIIIISLIIIGFVLISISLAIEMKKQKNKN